MITFNFNSPDFIALCFSLKLGLKCSFEVFIDLLPLLLLPKLPEDKSSPVLAIPLCFELSIEPREILGEAVFVERGG